MLIFSLESSGRAASAAINDGEKLISFAYLDRGLTHSETLMPLCDRVFAGAGLCPRDIDYFAATTGPGSFTGLRIGISIIKGMALAVDRPCVGVSVNTALATAASGFSGRAITVSDARAGRVFAASFLVDGDPVRLSDDDTLGVDQLEKLMPEEKGRDIFIGDAAQSCYNVWAGKRPGAIFVNRLPTAEHTAAAARILIEKGETVPCELLNPVYLQPSQAERNLKK